MKIKIANQKDNEALFVFEEYPEETFVVDLKIYKTKKEICSYLRSKFNEHKQTKSKKVEIGDLVGVDLDA